MESISTPLPDQNSPFDTRHVPGDPAYIEAYKIELLAGQARRQNPRVPETSQSVPPQEQIGSLDSGFRSEESPTSTKMTRKQLRIQSNREPDIERARDIAYAMKPFMDEQIAEDKEESHYQEANGAKPRLLKRLYEKTNMSPADISKSLQRSVLAVNAGEIAARAYDKNRANR